MKPTARHIVNQMKYVSIGGSAHKVKLSTVLRQLADLIDKGECSEFFGAFYLNDTLEMIYGCAKSRHRMMQALIKRMER